MKQSLINVLKQSLQQELRRKRMNLPVIVLLLLALAASFYLFDTSAESTTNTRSAPSSLSYKKGDRLTQCTMKRLSDGDSFRALCLPKKGQTYQEVHIRIFGIDAPEMGQKPWGERSKRAFQSLVGEGVFSLEVQDIDRYRRVVAKVYKEGRDLGLEMVKLGEAVVYHQYNRDPEYLEAEKRAQTKGLGIWSRPGHHQDPAGWRRLN